MKLLGTQGSQLVVRPPRALQVIGRTFVLLMYCAMRTMGLVETLE